MRRCSKVGCSREAKGRVSVFQSLEPSGSRNFSTRGHGTRQRPERRKVSPMPDPYLDPVLMVGDDLARRGVKASAVAEACQQVSQDIIARKWFHIEGVPFFKADGKPAITVDQFCDQLVKDKPHYLFEEHEVDDADVCFLGVDGKRTLRAAGDFIKKYGEAHYRAVRDQYGCVDDSAMLAGKKPGP